MATQQLLFDILANAKGVDKTFQEVVDSAESMAGKLGAVGAKATSALFSPKTAMVAGGIAGAAIMQGLGTAINMDGATRKMSAGLALTGPESERAGAAAGKLYSDAYGESFEDVTAAVSATMSSISGMRGASEADIEAMTGSVMDLSKAFEIDVTRTAQVAGQMITTGLAKNGKEAADLLAASLSKVPVNVREDVLDAIDEYGPMFAALGMSGGEAMTLLADASAKGMYGIDKTGDALKEFTIRATDMSKATGDAYKTLGLDQHTMTTDLLKGGDTARKAFDTIISGLGDMKDPAAQSQAALALFGTPIEDLGTSEIPKFIDSLLNSQEALGTVDGAAAKLGDTINDGPGSALTTFQRTAETSLGALGAQILPVLTPILQGLTQFAPIIGPAVIALGALAAVIGVVNFVMATSPVGWIVIGIVALIAAVVALVMNWETVVAFLQQAWAGFVGWFQGVMGGFFGWWDGVWNGFIGWTQDVWNGFVGFLSDVWNGFVGWIQGIVGGFVGWWNGVWSAVGAFISGIWSGIAAAAVAGFHMFIDPIIAGITGLWSFISTIFTNIGNFIAGVWTWISNLAIAIIQAFIAEHGAQLMAIWNNVVAIFTAIGSFIAGIWNGIVATITAAVTWVWGVVTSIFTAVWGFISTVFTAIGEFFVGIWNWYVTTITTALQAAWAVISGIFTAVWGFIAGIFTAIGGFIGSVWATIVGIISGAVSAVWGAIVGGFNAAYGFIVGIFSAVGGFLGGIWNNIVSGVAGMIGNVLGYLGGLGGQIMGVLSGAGSWLFDIGRNIVQGLMSGISSLAGSIGNFFLNLIPGWIVGPFKAALGIASPSKVFAGFGENIGEGVLVGVGRMQSSLDNKMSSLVTVPDMPDINAGDVIAGSRPGNGNGSSAGVLPGSGTAAGGRETVAVLSDEDRQLMRDFIAAADRPFIATLNDREFLTASREAERKGNRR
ncbi:phage tail tape measure protein [Arthrobacter sp. 18067]|uniref:phage tail tape measure protein n=1 Tax=Arthrobacter sp. 18067 TaxID=2681413 RepID=UPI00135A3DE2|nr:phage tail tape measure protein [Arthrobacter sp. 18067]